MALKAIKGSFKDHLLGARVEGVEQPRHRARRAAAPHLDRKIFSSGQIMSLDSTVRAHNL